MNLFCVRRLLFEPILNITNCNSCLKVLREILIPLDEQFVECKFNNRVFNCSEHFQQYVFNHYLCYNFNGLDIYRNETSVELPTEWSIDEGYSPKATLDAFPRRALGSGSQYSLSLLLRANEYEIDAYCTGLPGFQVRNLS
jgi:Amiloride-sensitive sodium channel